MFSDSDYWNKRYSKNKGLTFDYITSYEYLKEFLNSFGMQTNTKILYIGCGSSLLPEKLFDEGFKDITCIDFSEVVISEMKERNKFTRPSIKYNVQDARDLSNFHDEEFDLIIDKGTLDCILCSNSPSISCLEYTSEIQRVIKTSGICIFISCSPEEKRLIHFKRSNLSFNVKILYIERVMLSLPIFNIKKTTNSNELNSIFNLNPITNSPNDNIKYNYIYIITKNSDWRQKQMNFTIIYDSLKRQESLDEIDERMISN